MKITKYALIHVPSGNLVGFETSGREDCEVLYYLDETSKATWIVDDAVNAEFVRQNSSEWCNYEYQTPSHQFSPEELEIVCLTTVVEESKFEVHIPTFREYGEVKYGSENSQFKDSRNYRHMCELWDNWNMKYKNKNTKRAEQNRPQYSMYDLQEYYRILGLQVDGQTPLEPVQ